MYRRQLREAVTSSKSISETILLLELTDVHVGYGQGHVLAGLSLGVETGSVVCLLGKNGVGKTTTLRTAMGLLRPHRGTVRFNGVPTADLKAYQVARRGVGYVPEDRRIFPRLTVEENLRVTRPAKTVGEQWTLDRIYHYFPVLKDRRGQMATTMSGGQQQMLCIARALAGNPALILLDEPSEGLAPLVVEELTQLLLALKNSGLTILLAEQNLAFARAVGDQVHVLDKGCVQFSGSFQDLSENSAMTRNHLFLDKRAYAALLEERPQ
jgi:branched-chain amino acid transport system ATP-binding protein